MTIWGATFASFVAARAWNSSLLSACCCRVVSGDFACVSILCFASACFVSTCRAVSLRRSSSWGAGAGTGDGAACWTTTHSDERRAWRAARRKTAAGAGSYPARLQLRVRLAHRVQNEATLQSCPGRAIPARRERIPIGYFASGSPMFVEPLVFDQLFNIKKMKAKRQSFRLVATVRYDSRESEEGDVSTAI